MNMVALIAPRLVAVLQARRKLLPLQFVVLLRLHLFLNVAMELLKVLKSAKLVVHHARVLVHANLELSLHPQKACTAFLVRFITVTRVTILENQTDLNSICSIVNETAYTCIENISGYYLKCSNSFLPAFFECPATSFCTPIGVFTASVPCTIPRQQPSIVTKFQTSNS